MTTLMKVSAHFDVFMIINYQWKIVVAVQLKNVSNRFGLCVVFAIDMKDKN
jgi:hypothetical protein